MNPDKPLDPCPCKKWQNGIRFSALVGHNLNCQHFAIAAEKHIETLIKRALKAEEAAPVPQAPPAADEKAAFEAWWETGHNTRRTLMGVKAGQWEAAIALISRMRDADLHFRLAEPETVEEEKAFNEYSDLRTQLLALLGEAPPKAEQDPVTPKFPGSNQQGEKQ